MAPEPPAKSRAGWVRQKERAILIKVQDSEGFRKALGGFSKNTGLDVANDQLFDFAEALCRCCLHEVEGLPQEQGQLAAVRTEAEQLRKKLTDCNLSTMKQMAALRPGGHTCSDLEDDLIVFHEPMAYLDQTTRELVMTIVNDKVRQLENGRAPPSLVEALVRHASALEGQGQGASEKELLEAQAELEKSRKELRAARVELEAAEERCGRLAAELDGTRIRLRQTETALAELREREAALRAAYDELKRVSERQQAEIERQQAEIERQKEEMLRQQAQIERQRAEIDQLKDDLAREKEANETLRAEVEGLKEQVQTYVRQVAKLEVELQALQGRYDQLEKEADEMREELRRRNNTRTHGTQTTLTGPKLDEQVAEIKRLKVMLEELQMKLKELMDKYRRKFGSEAKAIADELGMSDLVKEDTVFQRLYDDALDRVERLDKLRAKIRKDRRDVPGVPDVSPPAEGSVLAAVEQSKLKGLRQVLGNVEPAPAPRSPALHPDVVLKQHSHSLPVLLTPSKALSVSKQHSALLPVLLTPPKPVSVLNMDLGGTRRGRREAHPGRLFP